MGDGIAASAFQYHRGQSGQSGPVRTAIDIFDQFLDLGQTTSSQEAFG
jgi:hypothetical protein